MGDGIERILFAESQDQLALIIEHGALAYGLALALAPDEAHAEEIFGRCFALARANPKRKPPGMRLGNWLCVLVRHAALNARRDAEDAGASMRFPSLPPMPSNPMLGLAMLIKKVAGGLDPARMEALRRVWLRGDDYVAMARYFQIPLADVRGWFAPVFAEFAPAQLAVGAEDEPDFSALAGEYALGLLSVEEAEAIEGVMAHDTELERAVSGWTIFFSGLAEQAEPQNPPHDLALRLSESAPESASRAAKIMALLRPALWGALAAFILLSALRYLA